jgi:hypothetical protein
VCVQSSLAAAILSSHNTLDNQIVCIVLLIYLSRKIEDDFLQEIWADDFASTKVELSSTSCQVFPGIPSNERLNIGAFIFSRV